MNCHSVSLTRKKLDWTPYIRLLMTKPTSVTIVTCSRTIVNNAPPPKRTQQQTSNSLGIPLRRTNVKEKKKSSREEQNPKRSYKGGVLLEFKNFVGCTSNSASAQSNTPQRKQAFLDNLQNNFSFILEIGQITYSIMCLLYKFAFTISIPASLPY